MHFSEAFEQVPSDSWLRRWMAAYKDTEPPRSYIFFVGLAMISAPIGRRAWIDHGYLKTWPMLSLLLIGPSGVGKGVSIGFGLDLVENLPMGLAPQVISGKPTPEKLMRDLRENPKTLVFAEELANFITKQKYMEGMIPFITDLLNARSHIELRTKTEGLVRVNEPAVTFVGGSTAEWLQEQLPDTAMTGGFLSRFLIINEKRKHKKFPLPQLSLSESQKAAWEHFRQDVIKEYIALVAKPQGQIKFRDLDVAEEYVKWYLQHNPLTGHLAPFAARAGEYILRMAMILAFASHRRELIYSDVRAAIALYRYIEERLQDVVVPFTTQGRLLAKVLEALSGEPLHLPTIRRAMRNFAPSKEVDRLVESLIMSGEIQRLEDGRFERIEDAD